MTLRRAIRNRSAAAMLAGFSILALATCTQPGDSGPTATPVEVTAPGSGVPATSTAVNAPPDATATDQPASAPSTHPVLNRVAMSSADGSVYIAEPDGSGRVRLETGGGGLPGSRFMSFAAWPYWSPDGRTILVTVFTPGVGGGFETSLQRFLAGSPATIPELVYTDIPGSRGIGGGVPTFPVWHPDGESIVVIADIGGGLATFLVGIDGEIGPAVSAGGPVYVDWSRDGRHMLVHTGDRLVLQEFTQGGERTGSSIVGNGSIAYRTPKFSPASDEYLFVDTVGGTPRLMKGVVGTGVADRVAAAGAVNAFSWSPDGSRIAYASGSTGRYPDSLTVFPSESGTVLEPLELPVLAFWWAPDNETLLLVTPTSDLSTAALQLYNSVTGKLRRVASLKPSPEMAFVVDFFDQYLANTRLWAPDSGSFLFPGVLVRDPDSGSAVQDGDEEPEIWVFDVEPGRRPVSLGKGGFANWSPN